MIIVITGTIAPDKKVGDLTIRDPRERLHQYIDAIEKMIEQRPDAKIVFCDNSGYDIHALDGLVKAAEKNGIKLELLGFSEDNSEVIIHGKGYGEGRIMKYVLENSSLIDTDDYLIKITGRLVVDNLAEIIKRVKKDMIYFNVPNVHRRDIIDTRLYAMPVRAFKDFFLEEYRKVDDANGYYLECAYRDVIQKNRLKSRNFPIYPRIVGKSGTGGISYEYKEWKCKIRDVLSALNFYGKVRQVYD